MFIGKYEDELFITWGGSSYNLQRIGTYFKEKAARYGMRIQEHGYLPYFLNVPKEKITIVRSYHQSIFQVKYKDYFFYKDQETEEEVKIVTGEKDIASLVGLGLIHTGSTHDDFSYELWVSRNEIAFVTNLEEDLGHFDGIICYIADSNKTHFLVKTNQYHALLRSRRKYYRKERWEERSDGWCYQWLPKEKVYVYKDHDETFRY